MKISLRIRTRYLLLIAILALSWFFIVALPKVVIFLWGPTEISQRVALVLGTTPYSDGTTNFYFSERIKTVVSLYEANQIDCILVSGDNSNASYNEPEYMTKALMKYGIPQERIYQDYAWFRTYDSIQRAREIFGLRSYYLVSQESHLERAYMIALLWGQNPKLISASSPKPWKVPRMILREIGARVIMYSEIVRGGASYTWGEKVLIDTDGYTNKKTCSRRT